MSVAFHPNKFGITVISKWTSNSGRWIIFLGTHYDGKTQCWDLGQFRTVDGVCQRLHFPDNKTGATIEYDELKKKLSKLKEGGERDEKSEYKIFGPDGKRAN